MLSKKYRLSYSDFKNLKPVGIFNTKILQLRVYETNYPFSKHAVVVTKKTLKKAIQRNKLRRRIYNSIKQNDFTHLPNRAFVWKVKGPVTGVGYKSLNKDVIALKNAFLKKQSN